MVDLLERVEALLELEGNSYQTIDYLSPAHQQRVLNGFYFNNNSIASVVAMGGSDLQSAFAATCSSSTNSSSHSGINEVWRERICEWSYQVIDHFDFSREVVSISTHYLDRVLAKTHVNKKLFQLVAMTSLYLAIKIYEPGTLNISSMIELSRGYFSPEQMAEMEMAILRALDWKLHPPTAYCFCKHILFLLPGTSVPMGTRYEILELARFLTELSVIDYFFVPHKASDVALAALLNSIEAVSAASSSSSEDTMMAIHEFEKELCRVRGGLDPHKPQVQECRIRLQILYSQGGYSRPESNDETRAEAISPVCVSFGTGVCDPYPTRNHDSSDVVLREDTGEENREITTITSSSKIAVNRELELEISSSPCLLRTSATLKNLHYENGESVN